MIAGEDGNGEAPLVSVIVPVYNAHAFVGDCLDSIVRQTYPHLEIILVDDGSTDLSRQVLHDWADHEPRCRLVLSDENVGAAASRNKGLSIARGSLVGFVDADDVIDPTMVATLVSSAEQCGAELSLCGYRIREQDGVQMNPPALPTERCLEGAELARLLARSHQDQVVWFAWRYLYRRTLLERLGLTFDEGQVFGEDVVFNVQALNGASRVVATTQCLYEVRGQQNSVTRTKGKPGLLYGLERQYQRIKDLYTELGVPERVEHDYLVYVHDNLLSMLVVNEWDLSDGRGDFRRRAALLKQSPLVRATVDAMRRGRRRPQAIGNRIVTAAVTSRSPFATILAQELLARRR